MAPLPRHEDECFFVAPIGTEGGEIRRRSDGVLDFVVTPAAEELGLQAVRADKVAKPGQITLQIVEHVLSARAVVADLTGANANVFYELAIRHTAKLPVVLICEADEIDRLPFDIQQMRVIPLDHRDLASAAAAKEAIVEQLEAALAGAVDSPISTVLNLQALEQGTTVERTLADIVTRIDALSRTTSSLQRTIERHGTGAVDLEPELQPESARWADAIADALADDGVEVRQQPGGNGAVYLLVDGPHGTMGFKVPAGSSPKSAHRLLQRIRQRLREAGGVARSDDESPEDSA